MDWSCFPFSLNLRCYLWWLGEDFVDVHQLVKFVIAGIRNKRKMDEINSLNNLLFIQLIATLMITAFTQGHTYQCIPGNFS
jgi:hypothetical protein